LYLFGFSAADVEEWTIKPAGAQWVGLEGKGTQHQHQDTPIAGHAGRCRQTGTGVQPARTVTQFTGSVYFKHCIYLFNFIDCRCVIYCKKKIYLDWQGRCYACGLKDAHELRHCPRCPYDPVAEHPDLRRLGYASMSVSARAQLTDEALNG
jgi:hypothetical protein